MLKYIIIFCIITFCHSAEKIGVYNGIILVLHSPIASFYWQHTDGENNSVNRRAYEEYVSEHSLTLEPNRWIVQGMWALKSRNILTNCETAENEQPAYMDEDLDNNFKRLLKSRWPSLKPNATRELSLWKTEFETYGSCFSFLTSFYFKSAMNLYEKQSIGSILASSNIEPGKKYALEDIVAPIVHTVGKWVYLKCIPSKKPREQYLLQIQLCYDPLHNLINCDHRRNHPEGIHECDRKKSVRYLKKLSN